MDKISEEVVKETISTSIETAKGDLEEKRLLNIAKGVLSELKASHPKNEYPNGDVLDELGEYTHVNRCLTLVRSIQNNKNLAVGVGFTEGDTFKLKWLFSLQSGEGIRVIKAAQYKFDKIALMAAPVGFAKGQKEERLNGIVAFYKKLGFKPDKDSQDIKYGGNVPMTWQFNKLMGGRPIP